MTGNNRWSYIMKELGFTNWLLNSHDGASSTQAINALNALITLKTTPKFILWCMGMNYGGDTPTNEINPTWLSCINQMLAICEENHITPILMTIPTCPSSTTETTALGNRLHTKLNEWVRNSGKRYIDIAASVEESGTLTWKGWGTTNAMLSSDQVHPSPLGAMTIAMEIIKSFPEIICQ